MKRLSDHQLCELLDIPSRYELDGFLERHGVPLDYTIEDFDREGAISARLWQKRQEELAAGARTRPTPRVIVVADTSPLRYLILIEPTHVLPALYGSVVVPSVVVEELTQTRTPDLVRAWLADRALSPRPTGLGGVPEAVEPAAGEQRERVAKCRGTTNSPGTRAR